MKNIVMNTLEKINKHYTLDEIKAVLTDECKKATFEITEEDYNEMFGDILYTLA